MKLQDVIGGEDWARIERDVERDEKSKKKLTFMGKERQLYSNCEILQMSSEVCYVHKGEWFKNINEK